MLHKQLMWLFGLGLVHNAINTSIFIGRGFVRGGCMFSRNMFSRNMFSRNIEKSCFEKTCFEKTCFEKTIDVIYVLSFAFVVG